MPRVPLKPPQMTEKEKKFVDGVKKRMELLPANQRKRPEPYAGFHAKRMEEKNRRRLVTIERFNAGKEGRTPEYLGLGHDELVRDLRMLGSTKEQICTAIGIDATTFHVWTHKHDTFQTAWESGGEQADALVARRMYQRATGMTIPAVKIFYDSKVGEVITEEYEEYLPPDRAAAEFILTNRQRASWKHRQDNTLSDADGNPLQPPSIVLMPTAAPPRTEED